LAFKAYTEGRTIGGATTIAASFIIEAKVITLIAIRIVAVMEDFKKLVGPMVVVKLKGLLFSPRLSAAKYYSSCHSIWLIQASCPSTRTMGKYRRSNQNLKSASPLQVYQLSPQKLCSFYLIR
jgi:hypothetical protein